MRPALLLFLSLAALPLHAVEPPTEATQRLMRPGLTPCPLQGIEGGGLCGTLPVWENRTTRQGRKIDLHFVVLPAKAARPAPDAVFYVAGGPGYSAVEDASDLGAFLGGMRDERDMVFVDQRGMGGSNPLRCANPGSAEDPQGYLRDLFPLEVIRECKRQLEAKADLTQYTTPIAMDDLDDVRAHLGYPRIDLIGASYGTRAVQVYVRQHPEHVRSVVLAGVVILDSRMPFYLARQAQESIEKLFDDCGADAACNAAFPDPRGDLRRALERFRSGPEPGFVHPTRVDSKTGKKVELRLPVGAFTTALRSLQYASGKSKRIPYFLHQAANGDFAAITEVAIEYFADPAWFLGAYLSITCAEDVARIDTAAIPHEVAGSYLGDDRVRQQLASCKDWPTAALPPEYFEPLRSSAPFLLISGWLDPATPPEWGRSVERNLPNSLNVIIRDGAHGPGGLSHIDCWGKLMTDFVHNGTPFGLDTSCAAEMKRPPFQLKDEPPPEKK